jgi:hypothetical protein
MFLGESNMSSAIGTIAEPRTGKSRLLEDSALNTCSEQMRATLLPALVSIPASWGGNWRFGRTKLPGGVNPRRQQARMHSGRAKL